MLTPQHMFVADFSFAQTAGGQHDPSLKHCETVGKQKYLYKGDIL